MSRHVSQFRSPPSSSKSKTKRDEDKNHEEKTTSGKTRRVRDTPSLNSTTSPPRKKHRMRDENATEEKETHIATKIQRPGPPPETPKSELQFPNRLSPPERPADEYGFYRFRYGENLSQRYKIVSKLGEGTFGTVLECWDRTEKQYVAIKIVRKIEKYRASAMLELEALNSILNNDREGRQQCIELDKWFSYRGHVCMVFQKHGPNLYDFLKKNNHNPFDVELVRDIGHQLLKGVAFLHDMHIIHTDLKPENILFSADGSGLRVPNDSSIKVIDFGSATFESGHHGRIVSTRHYRAPEVVVGAKWSYPCDLWSVGCILIELITGETLFQTHEDMEHLAMMERVLGPIPASLAKRSDQYTYKLFNHDGQLNWPHGASNRKSIRAVRRLMELREWIFEVGHKSVRPHLDDFVEIISQLMKFEPSARISAKDALKHQFFAPVAQGTRITSG